MNNFNEMNLPLPLAQAVEAMKFQTPTPIQSQSIPLILSQKDLIGCAQTGSGKTAAFSIPLIMRLLENPQKTGLILCPTRELATQISDVLRKLSMNLPQIKNVLLTGGSSLQPQLQALMRKPRILVATPGRLLDFLRRKKVSLGNVDMVVLDEADRMLDMGFAPQLNEILKALPKTRQTLLFSATLPQDILKMASKWLVEPARVNIGTSTQPAPKIKQSVVQTTRNLRNDVLLDELNARQGSVLVFTRTKHQTDKVANHLREYGHSVARIHGDRSQNQRNSTIEGFRAGRFRILVATDVVARGLDVPHIAHVINYELPQAPEDYVHRIGRTGRAGAEGEAVSFLLPEDTGKWRQIARQMGLETPAAPGGRHSSQQPRRERGDRGPYGQRPRQSRDRDHNRGRDRSHNSPFQSR